MNTPHGDDLIKYLTNRQNLSFTLDILSHGDEIRRQVFCEFWRDVDKCLRATRPRTIDARDLSWSFWPNEKRMDTESAGLYSWPSQFGDQSQGINFSVASDTNQSLFFGLCWEKAPKPRHRNIPVIAKRTALLAEKKFKQTTWWLGWKYISNRNQHMDGLLRSYAKEREIIYRQIQESLWPFVEETFDLVVKANRALRNL